MITPPSSLAVSSLDFTLSRRSSSACASDGLTVHATLGARYYAPWLARWTSCDPKPSPPASAYAYVGGHPLTHVDPTGREEKPTKPRTNNVDSAGGDNKAAAEQIARCPEN